MQVQMVGLIKGGTLRGRAKVLGKNDLLSEHTISSATSADLEIGNELDRTSTILIEKYKNNGGKS